MFDQINAASVRLQKPKNKNLTDKRSKKKKKIMIKIPFTQGE